MSCLPIDALRCCIFMILANKSTVDLGTNHESQATLNDINMFINTISIFKL
jgi:hypothetical protein